MTRKSKLPEGFERNPQIRTNRGYWDGVYARERGRLPEWDRGTCYRSTHPLDQKYGEGFWMGFYGDEPPKGAVL